MLSLVESFLQTAVNAAIQELTLISSGDFSETHQNVKPERDICAGSVLFICAICADEK